jgi:hypothetical protein
LAVTPAGVLGGTAVGTVVMLDREDGLAAPPLLAPAALEDGGVVPTEVDVPGVVVAAEVPTSSVVAVTS